MSETDTEIKDVFIRAPWRFTDVCIQNPGNIHTVSNFISGLQLNATSSTVASLRLTLLQTVNICRAYGWQSYPLTSPTMSITMGRLFYLVTNFGGFIAQKSCIQWASRDICRNQGRNKRDTLCHQFSLIPHNISGWCYVAIRVKRRTNAVVFVTLRLLISTG
jgi:hypothetical protein